MKVNSTNLPKALITDIQRFCMHDGPGIRTTVFFKGCPLRCLWCHNPETQDTNAEILFTPILCIGCEACKSVCDNHAHNFQTIHTYNRSLCTLCEECATVCSTKALTISGYKMDVADIIEKVKKDVSFYGNQGGLTVSGGEPTMQEDALISLLDLAKKEKISTAIETSGVFPKRTVDILCKMTDYFLFDVKDTNVERLKNNTGADYKSIISNLHDIDDKGNKIILRCIIIPGVNMTDEHAVELIQLYKSLSNCLYVELLPYHPYGTSKGEHLGRTNQIVYEVPIKEDILNFASKFTQNDVPIKCYGSLIK